MTFSWRNIVHSFEIALTCFARSSFSSTQRYFLAPLPAETAPATAPPAATNSFADAVAERQAAAAEAAEARRQEAEERKAAALQAAEERRQEAEERKAVASRAAEERRREAAERKAAAAEEARERAEQQRQVAEQRRQEAEERKAAAAQEARERAQRAAEEAASRKAAAAEAAERKRQEAEAKRQETEANKAAAAQAAADKKAVAAKEKEALSTLSNAKPGATISLFGLFGGADKDVEEEKEAPVAPTRPKVAPKPQKGLSRAPKGVPTISNWEQNRDGSVTGFIKGSFSFGEGDAVTTSPIRGKVEGGSVVVTESGSQ